IFKDFFFNSSQNFILLRKDKMIETDLDIIVQNNIYDENYGINYLKLLSTTCSNSSNLLLRAGGDGGKTSFSLQLFVHKKVAQNILSVIRNHLNIMRN
ncbi:MAG: hypothetical protein AAGI07_02060, partial [Bacteroidota bacterium]